MMMMMILHPKDCSDEEEVDKWNVLADYATDCRGAMDAFEIVELYLYASSRVYAW